MMKLRRSQRYALFSCSDKTGISPLAQFFLNNDYTIISTGGTLEELRKNADRFVFRQDWKNRIKDVSEVTHSPPIMGGRVKTLHPIIHGGILADRDDVGHMDQLERYNYPMIDVVVSNLYPFEKISKKYEELATLERSCDEFDNVIENIDIGGVAMIRAASKNYKHVTVITDPEQYSDVIKNFTDFDRFDRFNLAVDAFKMTSKYDKDIYEWTNNQKQENKDSQSKSVKNVDSQSKSVKNVDSQSKSVKNVDSQSKSVKNVDSKKIYSTTKSLSPVLFQRKYTPQFPLKYGTNPHQLITNKDGNNISAFAMSIDDGQFPFNVMNGSPSYINILDAINSWQLVNELKDTFESEAAASFKHTSPAGAAIYLKSDNPDVLGTSSECEVAYRKARGGDPMCSFGDFIAISGVVDKSLAQYIKGQVSDGIIAQNYTSEARDILSKKKKGGYVMLQGQWQGYIPNNPIEIREMYGMSISQPINIQKIEWNDFTEDNIYTKRKRFNDSEKSDLMLANTCLKYAQSNNVALALGGQLIGISAGQQSRIHSVKLAVHKSKVWLLRHDDDIKELFKKSLNNNVKSQQKVNLVMRLIEYALGDDLTDHERTDYSKLFKNAIIPDKELFKIVKNYKWNDTEVGDICLASDAFFPFRDSIDCASKIGVTAITQPGGSIRDRDIFKACDKYDIVMSCHNKRIFTH